MIRAFKKYFFFIFNPVLYVSGSFRGRTVTAMTPPLSSRCGNKPLPSPASSPNLSIRSAVSAPPAIRIENSAPEFPTEESPDTDFMVMQQKVLQLPPVNTWVPKGESLFSSILDSRSPQVYRRTNIIVSKPASFPQSTQSSIQSSRVSWPQRSQSYQPQISPPVSRHAIDTQGELKDSDKSPKLLRKCTSFDMERSKPFPTRSMMSSPMLLKKGTSVEEGDNTLGQFQSPKLSKWSASNTLESESDRIIHKEEEELVTDPRGMADSESFVSTVVQEPEDVYDDSSVLEFDAARINESLEDPNIPETAILNDIVNECNKMAEIESKEKQGKDHSDQVEIKVEQFSFGSSPELGAKPKTKKLSADSKKNVKIKTSEIKQKSKDSPKTTGKSKSGPISGKTEKASEGHEKSKSKTPSSTVKTALLSSAAKLKAMSRKSPVTLLSYKSHSISIPDQSDRPERPFSTSDVDTGTVSISPGIHQTESSPTVLTGELSIVTDVKVSDKPTASPTTKRDSKKSGQVQAKPAQSSKKNVRPCETLPEKNVPRSSDEKKTVKSKTVQKTTSEKASKSSLGVKSASVDKQAVKGSTQPKLSVRSSSETAEPRGSKKKVEIKPNTAKKETRSTKDMKPKSRMASKRDSVSSVNSDSSKKSDHFHDCCHVRRKPDKK